MDRAVLDSSALLAFILAETGADEVKRYIGQSKLSTVNLSEVVAKLADKGASQRLIRSQLDKLRLSICDFDADMAYAAGILREKTKQFGISLGDRACIATAQRFDLPAVTADQLWAELDVGVEIIIVRAGKEQS